MTTTMAGTSPTVPATLLSPRVPPLENGDRLTRDEFERRYAAMPHVEKAELLEGIVHMPSPVRFEQHAGPQAHLIGWLFHYVVPTPAVRVGGNATVRMDLDNEPQPDAVLFVEPAHGGSVRISEDGYIEGAPELVAEVAASTVSIDLHVQRRTQSSLRASMASATARRCW